MRLIVLIGLIVFLSGLGPARSDDAAPISPRALDLNFAAAVEETVAEFSVPSSQLATGNWQLAALIDRLDADRYADRERAGAKLLAACTAANPKNQIPRTKMGISDLDLGASADPSAVRWLLRARAVERRPEVRYWLNRILRSANRCDTCDGLGYCATYRPVASEAPAYSGVPCRRCGRSEWQHGEQWIGDGCYGRLACEDCHGLGTYWTHYAVD
jgi:hypothetical protein